MGPAKTVTAIIHLIRACFFLDLSRHQPDWLRGRLLGRSQRELRLVSFVGGPLDGWTETVEVDVLDRSQDFLTIPVSSALLQIARGELPECPSEISSVARYAVERGPLRWIYNFTGSDASQLAAAIESGEGHAADKQRA